MHTVTFSFGTFEYNPATDCIFKLYGLYSVAKDHEMYLTCNAIAEGIKQRGWYGRMNMVTIDIPQTQTTLY